MEESKQFNSHFEEISSKKHSDGTKLAYAKKVNVFKRWIKSTYPECIDNNEECFILSEITSDIIKQFFDHVVKYKGGSKNDQLKSFSTPEGYRSALVNMYKSVNVSLPEIFGNELNKGYRNEIITKN
jgi:viroplasmin and RNaseH domain-containing protein